MNKKILATAKVNNKVYICDETLSHMKAHPDVELNDIRKAINNISLSGTFFMESVDLHETVGKDHCVFVPEDKRKEIKMVQRPNREGLTPMIDMEPQNTSLVTVGLCVDDDGLWTMFTAFYGVKAPKEPWDKTLSESEREESEEFLSTHALCM